MIPLKTKGKAANVISPIIGKVTRYPDNINNKAILLTDRNVLDFPMSNYTAVLTTAVDGPGSTKIPFVSSVPSFDHLFEGDIVCVNPDGGIRTLYRVNSFQNVLFATERCNSNCLMCSQPPKNRDDVDYLHNIAKEMIPLIPKDCQEICITGGEPTLLGSLFFDTLKMLKAELPETEIHVLTNGRSFAWPIMAEKLAEIDYTKLMLGIPLYADYYQIHDYIVQAKDAFNQTVIGLHNLARYNQRVEIRIVLHKQSIPRLTKLARYIFKNFPFAEHVAFMGLEYVGYTPHNIDKLWIDPYDYMDELGEAVEFLSSQGMRVSIYNTQLCVMPENLWKFARKSISDWKNSYLPECDSCSRLNDCGGLFTWNLNKHSSHIKAF